MKKRLFALALVLCLALSLLAGCGGGAAAETAETVAEAVSQAEAAVDEVVSAMEEAPEAVAEAEGAIAEAAEDALEPAESEDTAAEEAPEPEEEAESGRVYGADGIVYTPVDLPITEEPVTYTIWYGEPFTQYVSDPATDVAIFPYLADLTGVSFEFSIFTMDNAAERFQLLYAADDLPNIIQDAMSYYTGTIDDAVLEDEFLYDYSKDLGSMPNLNSTLEAYPEAKKTLTSGDTGYMVSFPEMYKDIGDISGYMIRQDYFDATGMDVPETYDELHDLMAAVHSATGSNMVLMNTGCDSNLGAGFGINVGVGDSDLGGWYVVDGQVKMGLLQPEFLDYITLVKDWYSEGIFNQDFVNSDRGDLGGFFGGVYSLIVVPPEIYNASMNVLGVPTSAIPMPVQDKGDELLVGGSQYSCLMDGNCWSINANVDSEDVAIIEKLVDWMYSEAGTQIMNWGEEGVTYTIENGEPTYTDLIVNNPDGRTYAEAVYLYATGNRTRLPFLQDYSRCFADFNDVQWEMAELYKSECNKERDYPLGAMMNNEQKASYNTVAADIATYISENVLQFIYGQKDLSEWDSFIDTVKGMGIETAIEAKQAAYDDYMNS